MLKSAAKSARKKGQTPADSAVVQGSIDRPPALSTRSAASLASVNSNENENVEEIESSPPFDGRLQNRPHEHSGQARIPVVDSAIFQQPLMAQADLLLQKSREPIGPLFSPSTASLLSTNVFATPTVRQITLDRFVVPSRATITESLRKSSVEIEALKRLTPELTQLFDCLETSVTASVPNSKAHA